ncbi:MAG: hypothetical protein ACYS8Z_17145, partial [Planctomycetota bacterium]
MRISRLLLAAMLLLPCSSVLYGSNAANPQTEDCLDKLYFQIKVIDSRTKRGVPLIELSTTNHLLFVTDS